LKRQAAASVRPSSTGPFFTQIGSTRTMDAGGENIAKSCENGPENNGLRRLFYRAGLCR